jgi:hypothetical protein
VRGDLLTCQGCLVVVGHGVRVSPVLFILYSQKAPLHTAAVMPGLLLVVRGRLKMQAVRLAYCQSGL